MWRDTGRVFFQGEAALSGATAGRCIFVEGEGARLRATAGRGDLGHGEHRRAGRRAGLEPVDGLGEGADRIQRGDHEHAFGADVVRVELVASAPCGMRSSLPADTGFCTVMRGSGKSTFKLPLGDFLK
jgi:hypothetical protein